jgi:hypothetical protein
MGTKINQIIKLWSPGLVLTSSFLKGQGINYDQQLAYKNSGWLESIGQGAYKRTDDLIHWAGGLNALQKQLDLQIHLGGKSALVHQGYSHYVQFQEQNLFLFMGKNSKLPKWFRTYDWNSGLQLTRTVFLPYNFAESFTEKKISGFDLKISTPERALLEMLYFVPQKQIFEEAFKIFEFMTSLRPDVVQLLLESCNSIKVTRLFLYMAEKQNHFWFKALKLERINLGSGKRVIVINGIFDNKYSITIPRESLT